VDGWNGHVRGEDVMPDFRARSRMRGTGKPREACRIAARPARLPPSLFMTCRELTAAPEMEICPARFYISASRRFSRK
jgi:hypothetical protein